jgi:transcriptional regulator of arginine metabolism
MPSAPAQQYERRRAIARLLEEHQISRQSELVSLLRTEGFVATQSSVSRDLRDLGAAKL